VSQAFGGTKQTQLQDAGVGRSLLSMAWATQNRIGLTQDGGRSTGSQNLQPSRAGDARPAHPLQAQHQGEGQHLNNVLPRSPEVQAWIEVAVQAFNPQPSLSVGKPRRYAR